MTNEKQNTAFTTEQFGMLKICANVLFLLDEWTHVAATYNSTKEIAVIYVNGEIKEGKNGAGALSEDWDGVAAFGYHNGKDVAGKPLLDFFDEIEMYDRELSPLEIRQLFMKCSDVLPYGMITFRHQLQKMLNNHRLSKST